MTSHIRLVSIADRSVMWFAEQPMCFSNASERFKHEVINESFPFEPEEDVNISMTLEELEDQIMNLSAWDTASLQQSWGRRP